MPPTKYSRIYYIGKLNLKFSKKKSYWMAPISQNPNAGPALNNTSSIWFWFHTCDEFNKRRENEAERFQKNGKKSESLLHRKNSRRIHVRRNFFNIYSDRHETIQKRAHSMPICVQIIFIWLIFHFVWECKFFKWNGEMENFPNFFFI